MGNCVSRTSDDLGEVVNRKEPSVLVIVGPSGVGKGTLINKLLAGREDSFGFSCSHTTRKPRQGEENGVHYHFTTKEEFEAGIARGEFLEYAHVHDNIYGTSLQAVKAVSSSGKCCILDIDVQGARQVRKSDLNALVVFIAPPSFGELENRLRTRGTENEEQVMIRSRTSKIEMESVKESNLYDAVLVNDDFESCFEQLKSIAEKACAGDTTL
jgi:guanylate kinase